MSYIVSVQRSDGSSITVREIEKLVASDPELQIESGHSAAPQELLVSWRSHSESSAARFALIDGSLQSTTTPSEAAIGKLQQISRALGARLVGEEGEDMTDIDVTSVEPARAVGWGCLVLISLVLLAAWWWFRG